MKLSSRDILSRLGSGQPIAAVCEAAGISRNEFDVWWRKETHSRVPATNGTRNARLSAVATIERDEEGIPHIRGTNDDDLFFAFGYAMAQDRLFQLDYLRRRALGRLSEVLGPEGFELDLTARTVGLHRIADEEWRRLPDETRRLVERFADGVNALIDDTRDNPPIEFDLLDYRPEPWRPVDSLAIAGEFRWYLTGRFPVIVIPELARRALGDGPLYKAFLTAEADEEAIMPGGSYPEKPGAPSESVGRSVNDPQEGSGSNNWVISGARSTTAKPLLASDPHIAFAAVSCWWEVHLHGGSFNVAGMAYAGMPAVMFGRTERAAWGITNNICSQRDLYQEKTDPAHPGCFLFDGRWEPAREIVEVIRIKGGEPVTKTIRLSRNGPIVDEILPAQARDTGPVSLRWLGSYNCGWLTALLNMDRAKSVAALKKATEPWLVPTFCVVAADVDGHIGYQCTGRIPIRTNWERGYRPGWDPAHQWNGVIPFEGMPNLTDPPRGWIATANNRVAADDFPYPLSGTWNSGYRGKRVRQMIEAEPKLSRTDFSRMHQDSQSLRAVGCVQRLISLLKGNDEERIQQAVRQLEIWDCRMEPDSVAATIFNVFFTKWALAVAEARFPREIAPFIGTANYGLSVELLHRDAVGWFASASDCEAAIGRVFSATLDLLTEKLGPDMSRWNWGRLHLLQRKHVLTTRGDLGKLLDLPEVPVRGDFLTVCNTGQGPNWEAPTGAGYRLIADLADAQGGLWAVDVGAQSGHPGSPHYDDQLDDWLNGRYHFLPINAPPVDSTDRDVLHLKPN
jgi:penicillin G amidase